MPDVRERPLNLITRARTCALPIDVFVPFVTSGSNENVIRLSSYLYLIFCNYSAFFKFRDDFPQIQSQKAPYS